jgi:hypothetical protein
MTGGSRRSIFATAYSNVFEHVFPKARGNALPVSAVQAMSESSAFQLLLSRVRVDEKIC